MPIGLFNTTALIDLQLTEFSCSVGATFWCLRSIGVDITQPALQQIMVPSLVSPDLGLLDSSGVTIARLLRERFGLPASNAPQVSFDDVAARAGRQPLAIGGRRWFVNPNTGDVTGHWVAVRRFEAPRLILANPGGTGPNFGQQALDPDDFARRGPFSAVWIDASVSGGFVIANTEGQGANVRAEPVTTATAVIALREGAIVSGDEHAWRQVTGPAGERGWVANEFLSGANGNFKVANTDGHGANLRRQPEVTAEPPITLLPEGTAVTGDEHAWRRITTADGTQGWIANEFLAEQA